MSVRQPHNKESGLTLIELMAAMVILAFGVVAALSILVDAHKANNMARAKNLALNAAEVQMETIFAAQPSDVTIYDNTPFQVGDLVGNGPNGEAGLIDVDPNEPHLVTITVVWQGQGALPRGSVVLRAIRSEAPRS